MFTKQLSERAIGGLMMTYITDTEPTSSLQEFVIALKAYTAVLVSIS